MEHISDFAKYVYRISEELSCERTSKARIELTEINKLMEFDEKDIATHDKIGMFMAVSSYLKDINAIRYYFRCLKNHLNQLFPSADFDTELKEIFQARENLRLQQKCK
jgi:hypothetical protein